MRKKLISSRAKRISKTRLWFDALKLTLKRQAATVFEVDPKELGEKTGNERKTRRKF